MKKCYFEYLRIHFFFQKFVLKEHKVYVKLPASRARFRISDGPGALLSLKFSNFSLHLNAMTNRNEFFFVLFSSEKDVSSLKCF